MMILSSTFDHSEAGLLEFCGNTTVSARGVCTISTRSNSSGLATVVESAQQLVHTSTLYSKENTGINLFHM